MLSKKKPTMSDFILCGAVGLIVLYLGLQFAAALNVSSQGSQSIILVALENFSKRLEEHPFALTVVPETGKVLGILFVCYLVGIAYYFTTRKNLIAGKEHGTAEKGTLKDIKDLFAVNIERKEVAAAKMESVTSLRGFYKKKAYRSAKKRASDEKARLMEVLQEQIQDMKDDKRKGSEIKAFKAERTAGINAAVKEYYEQEQAVCWKPDQYEAWYKEELADIEAQALLKSENDAVRARKREEAKKKHEDRLKAFYSRSERIKGIRKRYKNADMLLTKSERICMYNYKTNNNILIIGGSGSGKTRGFVMPNILQAHSSYVVTDPKGEILEKAGTFLEQQGYKIRVLNLDDKSASDYYNPFYYIHNDAMKDGMADVPRRKGSEERVLMLIEAIIINTDGGEKKGGSDPFWDKAERLFLQAVFFFTCDGFGLQERNMNTVLNLIAMLKLEEEQDNHDSELDYFVEVFAADRGKEYCEKFVREYQELKNDPDTLFERKEYQGWTERQKQKHISSMEAKYKEIMENGEDENYLISWGNQHIGVQQFREFREKAAGKTAKSIVISAVARLAPFRTPEVKRIFSKDGMLLDRVGEEKTVVFVVVPPTDDTFNFIAGMLFTQLFQELQYCATQVHKHDGQRLPVPCRFILDEFANTCTIPNFVKILAYARSFGIGIVPILQSLEQIKNMYKDEWGVIVDNCTSLLFLGGVGHLDTLKYISERIGKGTFDKRTLGHSYGRQGSSSKNFDVIGRDLIDPAELSKLPKDECILLIAGRNPFHSKKYEYQSHPNYRLTSDGNKTNTYYYTPAEPFVDMDGDGVDDYEILHGEEVSTASQIAAREKYRVELPESQRAYFNREEDIRAAVNAAASDFEGQECVDDLGYDGTFVSEDDIRALLSGEGDEDYSMRQEYGKALTLSDYLSTEAGTEVDAFTGEPENAEQAALTLHGVANFAEAVAKNDVEVVDTSVNDGSILSAEDGELALSYIEEGSAAEPQESVLSSLLSDLAAQISDNIGFSDFGAARKAAGLESELEASAV